MRLLPLLLVLLAFRASSLRAQIPSAVATEVASADPLAWSIRDYYDPKPDGESTANGQLVAPPVPPEGATEEEIIAFLARSNEVVLQKFRQLPKGSHVVYDPTSKTLVVRTLNAFHDEFAASARFASLNRVLRFHLRIIEADAPLLRQGVAEAVTLADHAAILSNLLAKIPTGESRVLEQAILETKSGQRASTQCGSDRSHLSELRVDKTGQTTVTEATRTAGLNFVVDPVLHEDAETLSVTTNYEYHWSPPTDRIAPIPRSNLKAGSVMLTDFHVAAATISLQMLSGSTVLLGVWAPQEEAKPPHPQQLQAAFLTADVLTYPSKPNPLLAEWLMKYGERLLPTPSGEAPPPPGTIRRSFLIPSPFFGSIPTSEAPSPDQPFNDPFGDGSPLKSPLEILQGLGVIFPKGSSTQILSSRPNFIILVSTTPTVMKQVSRVIHESIFGPGNMGLTFSLDIVQAERAFLEELASVGHSKYDQTTQWKLLNEAVQQQRATIEQTLFLRTISGQRVKLAAGTEFANLKEIETQKPPDDNSTVPASDPAEPLKLKATLRNVGVALELDPSIDEDKQNVHLSLQLDYDFAPPTIRPRSSNTPKERALLAGNLELHRFSINTATILADGAVRMVGLWKPSGKSSVEGKDLLQAAFLQVKINRLDTPEP